jgi:hypothetical protein
MDIVEATKCICYIELMTMHTKSLYISRAVSNFYGTEIEIWAGFGPVGNNEKENWADYEQLLREFFHLFMGKFFLKIFLKKM